MNNQDAIYILKWNLLDRGGCDSFSVDEKEALNKAIDALQQVRKVGKWVQCDWKHLEHGFMESDVDAGMYCTNCRTVFKKDKMVCISLEEKYPLAVADLTQMHADLLLAGKRYRDMTGNNINHPNDYLIRVYAQVILKTLIGKDE